MTDKCKQWLENPLINPKTHRKIKFGGPTFNKLKQECVETSHEFPQRSKKMRNESILCTKSKNKSKSVCSELEPLNKKMEELSDQLSFHKLEIDKLEDEMEKLVKFYDKELLKEDEWSYSEYSYNLEKEYEKKAKVLLKQMDFHEIEIVKLEFELKELFWQISKIKQSARRKIGTKIHL